MRAVDLRIDDLFEAQPTGGVLRFGGNRVLLFDAVAMGLLRKQLIDEFGVEVARGMLTRLGYSHGWRAAETLRETVAWDDELEWRRAGGRIHRLQGLVSFEPVQERAKDAVAEALWRDSYEAEQHILHLGAATEPVCWSLCGFASGYLSRVIGEPVYAVEQTCCGVGDAVCRMVAKTENQWGPAIEPHRRYYERDCLDGSLRELRNTVRRLEKRLRAQRRALGDDADAQAPAGMIAKSRAMRRVLDLASRVAKVDSTVLLSGESGVGKERVARFIHDQSPRTVGPFVAVNCAALPPELLESELFGHARGAFSGAISDRAGLFEAAHGGTLLLDEIGDVPAALQVRLLRVLQEREVRRVGENHDRPVDVRVIAATHRDLDREAREGRFREDLLFRLCVVKIDIPPLRERRDDILPLARMKLLESATRFKRDVRDFTPAVAKVLIAAPWRGNVRELSNAIERAVVFAESDCIDLGDLQLDFAPPPSVGPSLDAGGADRSLEQVEKEHILRVLREASGNRSEAARRLGIGPATLFRKLKKYGVTGARSG